MQYINGITFAPFCQKGVLSDPRAKESLRNLKERTGADFIILAPQGMQENAQSEEIDFTSDLTAGDDELREIIAYAHELGIRVALKPTVNCLDGTWRAHINFFDKEVPCEPKWSNWFRSHTAFHLHFAALAEECGCEMYIAGCEMVNSERREAEWRQLIADIRTVYSGPVSYNTDKYQEECVKWWDCVDVISSSGYYPIGKWEQELDRIEAVVKKFNKPFFFAECGCMSSKDSYLVPNNWHFLGEVAMEQQAEWYRDMFTACEKRPWVEGFCLWSWTGIPYSEEEAKEENKYDIYLKPAEKVVQEFYTKKH